MMDSPRLSAGGPRLSSYRVSQAGPQTAWGRLKRFDLYPKINEDFFTRTVSGGVVTLVAGACMLLLFLSELRLFLQVRTDYELNVDTSRGETIQINLDITLPHMACSVLSLDVMDVSGNEQLDVSHNMFKRRLDPDGRPHVESPQRSHVGHDTEIDNVVEGPNGTLIDTRTNSTYCGSCYGAEDPEKGVLCCNTCSEVRERYRARGWALAAAGDVAQCKRETFAEQVAMQTGEGCQVYGHFEVNKVAGNFHLAPGKSYQQGAVHVHDLQLFGQDAYFNFSHVVNKLSYGADFPGLVNPLDAAVATQRGPQLMYQYFIKVVPTVYRDMKGSALRTAQFSVTEYHKTVDIMSGRTLPGIFFFYDINPIQVRFAETRSSFLHFVTSVCAIVGGVFTVSGLIDSGLYHGTRVLRKKMELGKHM